MSAVTSGEFGFHHLLERKLEKRNLTLDLLGSAMEDRTETRQLKSMFTRGLLKRLDYYNYYSNRFLSGNLRGRVADL